MSTWTAPAAERGFPDQTSDERRMLEEFLDFHRQTLLWKCSGLAADQLRRRAVPTSNLSLLGIVRHMVEVERYWFGSHAAQQDRHRVYCTEDNRDADFDDVDTAEPAADFEAYHDEVQRSRDVAATIALDDVVPPRHPGEEPFSIRWIYVHMIEEYARHNGHADLLREAIDGATGE